MTGPEALHPLRPFLKNWVWEHGHVGTRYLDCISGEVKFDDGKKARFASEKIFCVSLRKDAGVVPAFIALTLYALLPIVRNTQVGLTQIPREMIEAAKSLALRPAAILWKIELPLAMPTLLAGVKTSAVVNVGTATIAAFIGAGGFGERIVTGLALNDQTMLLAGAIPVAVLAVAVQGAFGLLEKGIVPADLRVRRN